MSKGDRYLTDKEKIAIYAIQHPDTPIGTKADQMKALRNSYGIKKTSSSADPWDTKTRMIKVIAIIAVTLILFLLAMILLH